MNVVYLLAAAAMGLLAALLATFCWLYVFPKSSFSFFFSEFLLCCRRLLAAEADEEFWGHYKKMMMTSVTFALQNIWAMSISVIPVGIIVWFLVVPLEKSAMDGASELAVRSSVNLEINGRNIPKDQETIIPMPVSGVLAFVLEGESLSVPVKMPGQVLASDAGYEVLFRLLGFNVSLFESGRFGFVMLRPFKFFSNPFWPFLTDIGLAFYSFLLNGAILIFWIRK